MLMEILFSFTRQLRGTIKRIQVNDLTLLGVLAPFEILRMLPHTHAQLCVQFQDVQELGALSSGGRDGWREFLAYTGKNILFAPLFLVRQS